YTAKQFARAIIMPNLKPPVTTTEQALNYRDRVLSALPVGTEFEALMTLYLTDNTDIDEIHRAAESEHVHAVKYYPAGATTNSDSGVTDITKAYPAIKAMAESGLPLLVHGEVTDPGVDIFDREKAFIDRTLNQLRKDYPELRIVFEHITTEDAVQFVETAPNNIAATVTPQHLLYNRNALFKGGIRPHYFCLPVLKRETHREALLQAAISGEPRFFLGTDSAPHARDAKETACGCAGIYTAHAAIELYAEAFEQAGALDRLEAFASHFGADFYKLPRNTDTITLEKRPWEVPREQSLGEGTLVPLRAGETVNWQLAEAD
ncbi:MAG: dihydroorotase, partial [Gammaproteobacteria bacterium]